MTARGQGRYRSGDWYVFFTPDAVVLVDDGLAPLDVQRLWNVLHGGADLQAVLAELDRTSTDRVFGVAVTGPLGLQTAVRPGVALLVDRGDGLPPLVDTGLDAAGGSAGDGDVGPARAPSLVRLIRVGAGGGADVALPLLCGVVRADDVEWTPSRATRRSAGRRAARRPAERPERAPDENSLDTRPLPLLPAAGRADPDPEPAPAPQAPAPTVAPAAAESWEGPSESTLLPPWSSDSAPPSSLDQTHPDDDEPAAEGIAPWPLIPSVALADVPTGPGDEPVATGSGPQIDTGDPEIGLMSQVPQLATSVLAGHATWAGGARAFRGEPSAPGPAATPGTAASHPAPAATSAPTDAGAGAVPVATFAPDGYPPARTLEDTRDPLTADNPAEPGGAPLVQAILCSEQHPNPVQATYCRCCGEALGFATAQLVPRPPLGLLRFSTGQEVVLDQNVIVGRAPRAERITGGELPRPVRIDGKGLDISRNHLEVRLEGWHVLVVDLGSRNGTLVTLPGRAAQLIDARVPCLIPVGTVVELTEDVTFTYEAQS